MAVFRTIKTSFWTDSKVINEMSPEDKYFFLYLLTNPQTTQLGIYEFVPKSVAFYLGYSVEAVKVLLDRFQNKYHMIRYSSDTSEVAIKNYLVHSIIKGGKPVMDCLIKEESKVKDKTLVLYIMESIADNNTLNGTVKTFLAYLNDKYENDNDKENENENDNDNECNVDVSSHVSLDVSLWDKIETNFEALWKLYPKKLGKNGVSKKSKRTLYDIGYEHMSRAINRYVNDTRDTDIRYVKYGSTFFNGGYIDYLDENYKQLKKANNSVEAHMEMARRWARGE